MSRPSATPGKTHMPFGLPSQVDAVAERLGSTLAVEFDKDKPDSNEFHGAVSPVTPLRTTTTTTTSTTVTNTSSSSSSSGSVAGRNVVSSGASRSHSGELTRSTETSANAADSVGSVGSRGLKPGHRRTSSGPLIYSGSSGSSGGGGGGGGGSGGSVSSPVTKLLPVGNICPSGKIGKTGMVSRNTRKDVLSLGTGNYGHGSIIRGGGGTGKMSASAEMPPTPSSNVDTPVMVRKAMSSADPEEVKRVGNELYRRGHFAEALKVYDRAIAMVPNNAVCRSNKAAALMGMGRLGEAVRECEEAVRLDPMNGRAHQRLASLHLRLGQVETARKHLYFTGELPDPNDLQKLHSIERHLSKCADARRIGDWKNVLRESENAIAAGADSSALLDAARAESLLRLHRLDEADAALHATAKLEISTSYSFQNKFLGMLAHSYLFIVRAQVDMALGRFEDSELSAEKAQKMDPHNKEVNTMWSNTKTLVRARARGNDLFSSSRFSEACLAYGEGLRVDPCNPVLYCNRAVCYSKLGLWENSIEDCSQALKYQPKYTKALLRRATSYEKLEKWADAIHDYEILRKELPASKEIAEALFHAQVSWKASRGEEVSNMKFGGEVEKIVGVEQFQAAISLPGLSVVYFMGSLNANSLKISPFVDSLCSRYPSVNFLKVDIEDCPAIAKAESVKIVPTFKIYKNGTRMKEMICPSQQVLEYSLRHYCV